MSNQQNPQERAAKVIEFLKILGSTEKRIEEVAKYCQISRTSGYHYINEFVKDVIMMDSDPDLPRRVLPLYNKDLPSGSDKLNAMDIEQLRRFVDEYCARNLSPPETGPERTTDTININDNPSRTMSYNNPNVDLTRDNTTDEDICELYFSMQNL